MSRLRALVSHALLAAFISIVAYTLLGTIGEDVNTIYSEVGVATQSAADTAGAGS